MPGNDLYPLKENILPQESLLPQGRTVPRPYTDLGGYGGGNGKGEESIFPPAPRNNDIANTVTTGELYNARRYAMYDPTKTEDDYAWGQSNWDKAANGILKGANLAGTTILGGFGMVAGALASAAVTHKLSTIWDNPILRGLDKWNNEVDNNILPNYYTDAEKNAAWYSPDNWFKTNFLFDKLVKNSGFAVGAMLSGNLADAALLRSGAAVGRAAMAGAELAESSRAFQSFSPLLKNMARAFSQGKNIEVANALEKEISSIADITARSSEIAKIAQSTNKFANFGDAGRRWAIATYSSAGESTFEALQTSNEFRNNLIQDWKDKHGGEEPMGDDLQKINEYAEKVGKTSFFGNMALLTITEHAQLPKLIGSSYAAEKQAANSLIGKVDDVLLKEGKYVAAPGATTKFGKLMNRAGGVSKYIFDPKEATQEGLQYALQVGTQNYFKKGYESKAANAVTDGFLYGLIGVNEKGEGVGALNSKEGAESIALGGITGGLMQIKGNIQEAKAIKSNTEQFIDKLNSVPKFQTAFKERLAAANRGVVLQEQQQDAVLNGDELEAKDLNADMMHNYLAPRIKYGRFDMVMDDISELKQKGSTEQGLADLKEEGLANINDTIGSYQKRLTKFESVAKNTEQIYKSTNLRYSGEILKDEKGEAILDADGKQQRKYSDTVIDKMVYAASKVADYDLRIPSVNVSLAEAGIDTQSILEGIIKNNKPNKEATAQALNQINDLDVRSDIKDDLKTKLSDTIELSLRRKMFLDEYNDIKTKPLNYEILPGYGYDIDEKDKTPVAVAQKDEEKPEKKLEIGKEYSLKESVLKEGSMLHLAPKISVLSQTLGGELEVKLPSGKVTFMSPEEFKKYQISDENNTSEEMSKILDDAIDTVLKDEKFKEVKKAIADIPGDKIEDKLAYINSLDDQSLINAIEKEFNAQTEEMRKQKEEAEQLAKQISKNKEQIAKEQKEIEATSGDVSTVDVESEEVQKELKKTGKEDKRRPADELFTGSITESEGSENPNFQKDPTQSAPHIKRSRRFLNNIKNSPNRGKIRAILVTYKNEKALGLEGLTQLSYSKEDIDLDTEEKKKAFAKEVMDPVKGFIAQVYTIQDGKDLYFSDENGNKIKDANGKEIKVRENVDLNQVVFQSQPTATIEYSDGSPKYREGEKEKAEAYQASYIQYRKDLFESPADANPPIFKILITRGVPRKNVTKGTDENGNEINISEKNHVGGILIPEAKISSQDNLILLPTNGSVEHNGKLLKFPPGTPVLQYGDNLEFLNNRKFTSQEAKTVYAVINALANKIVAQTKAGKKVTFDPGYKAFLKNMLYWKAGAKTDNQFFVDGTSIYVGKSAKYAIGDVANKKDEIVKQLEGMFMNINNFTIKDSLSKRFYEYTLDKNDNLVIKEWKNYQTYLLSAKNPDGSARSANETPLSTAVAKPTDDLQSFKSKSSVLIGLDLPITEVAKPEPVVTAAPVTTVTKIGKHILDDATENTMKVSDKFGEVKFTAAVDENGKIIVTPKANKEIQIIAKDRDQVVAFENWLLENGFEPGKTSEEKVLKVASIIISNKLIDEQAKQPVAEEVKAEAPKVEEKKEEVPVSTDAKAETKEEYVNRRKSEIFKQLKDKYPTLITGNTINPMMVQPKYMSSEDIDLAQKVLDTKILELEYDAELAALEGGKVTEVVPTVNIEVEKKKLEDERDKKIEEEAPIQTMDYPLGFMADGKTISLEKISELLKEDRQNKLEALERIALILAQAGVKPLYIAKQNTEAINKILTYPNYYGALRDWEGKDIDALSNKHVLRIRNFFNGFQFEDIKLGWGVRFSNENSEYTSKQIKESNSIQEKLAPDEWSTEPLMGYVAALRWAKMKLANQTNRSLGEYLLDTQKEIRDEYQAKIDALEDGKPTGEPKDFSGFSGPSSSFRAVVPREKGVMTDAELQLFKEWHAKNVPNIPFEVLHNLITINGTKKAWGVYENGVAKFVKGGLKGTEYHEIFHGIFQGFLNDAKQQELRDEFRERQGSFTDRMTGREIEYSKATDSQIEDKLADEFTDFRLGKIKAKSLTQKIVDFFRSILDFIKSFVNKPSAKDSLFDAIDSGKFKEAVPGESKIGPDYRAATGLTEAQTHEFVDDMTGRASGIIYNEADKNALFNPLKITSKEMFSRIEGMFRNEKNAAGVSKREAMGDEAWEELVVKTKESLRTLGVNFNEDDTININDESQVDRLYAPEPFTIDAKKSSPFAIKFTLATLFETKATNQENELSLVMPEPKISSVGGYKLLNFSRAFATVLDKLCNTTKVSKAVEKLADLASYDSNYVRLFSRVGGSYSKDENGKMSKIMDFSQFQNDDWRLFIQMMQTFTKQKPEALIQYKNGNSVHTAPANLFTAIKTKQRSWIENIRARAQDKTTSFITYSSDSKAYKVDTAKIKEMPLPKNPKDMTEFLGKIGVIFPMEVYSKLKTESLGGGKSQTTQFAEAVGALYSQLGKNGDIYSVTGKALDVDSRFAKLAELYIKVTNPNQDSTYPNVEGEKTNAYSENNTSSVFENEFNEAETIKDLLKSRPELHDLFNNHSLVLKEGGTFFNEEGKRIKEIKIKYIQGTSDSAKNKGTTTAKLNLGGRFTQEINQNLNGDYYILIPADSSTEWMINLGNHISFEDFAADRADKQIHDIFEGYLMDDIALALDADNREQLKNVGSKAKELRFFKDILSKKDSEGKETNQVLIDINKLLANDKTTYADLETYVKNNLASINESVDEYINNTVTNTIETLMSSNEVVNIKNDNVSYPSLDDTFTTAESLDKNNMSLEELNNVIKFANTNYIINNIEMHKLIFGDPYQFKITDKKGKVILDETKRIKSFLSPRRTTFDSPEYNTWLRNNRNQVAGVELTSDDYGYQDFKEYTNTVTLTDMTVASSLANTMSLYSDINEADAMSWLMDGTYREIKLKNGQWTDAAEDWHQWQMAYTRQKFPGYKYTSEALKKHDAKVISKPAPKHLIEDLKPIVSGAKYGATTMDNVLDKFSQMPIYYSMVQGTTLEKLYDKMFKNNIGYAIFESGRKVGITETHDLYTPNGDINDAAFNNIIPVSWKSYGIQVETTQEGEKSQTRGSQLTKLASMDLFENGEASPEALAEYRNNVKILNEMHRNAFKQLLNKLGLVDTGSGYTLPDKTALSNALVAEMLRREMSDNAKETLKLDENKQFRIPFEASPSYVQIRNIIYSMIDKAIISPKMNGGAHVQVPVTGFESALKGKALIMKNEKGVWEKISKEKYATLDEEQKKGVMLSDDTLKFYVDEKGKRYCEVMLPHWFKNKFGKKTDKEILTYLNKPENEDILRGIGFRIPTQALSSVEVFKVKGFLPQYMGATVVVPSEITKKAGSDFDIDKLNMYLKSVYKDENGNIKIVKNLGSEESTKAFYANVYEKTIQKKIDKIERFDEFRDKLLDVVAKLESSEDEEVDPEVVLTDEEYDFYQDHIDIFSQIEEQAAEKDIDTSDYILSQMKELDVAKEKLTSKMLSQQLKDDFVNDMYKRSLENAYYDSLEKLITLPENFQRLISPIGDAGLSNVADDLDRLRGYNESNVKNRILDRNYMTSLRHAFVVAKRWVGISAVNITNHSLAQKSKIYIDPKRIEAAPKADKKFLKDGSMILPHNTVSINGEDVISLSGRTVKDSKELISDRLSGYATAFVDVAKDPYIMKIIKSDLIVGTFMFLERVGVGPKAIKFLNQPIISEYISMLDNLNTKNLYNADNIELIKMRFDTTENEAEFTGIDISDKHLDDNIENYYIDKKLTPAQNAEQHAILDEFLKYAKMADYNFKFTQATNYDTTKFRSGDTLSRKQMRTDTALKTNIISSVEDILNNTFIGEQERLLSEFAKATGEIFKLEKDQFRVIIDSVLDPYKANEYMSQDNYEKIANKIRSSLIDYAVQIDKGYNTSIKALLVDVNTSIAKQLSDAKEKYKDSKILNDLEIESSPRPGGAMTVKLNVNLKDAYDENLYTGMMAELRDNPGTRELYNNLVVISILQGSYQSAVSIKNIIPIEDYSRIVAPVINGLQSSPDIEAFSKIGAFQRTNFKDDIIMPVIQPKFFLASDAPIYAQTNQFGDHYADIFQYYSSMFPNIEQLKIKSTDRRLLLLSEKYNSFDLKNDFIKIPRVVTDRVTGDSIDMLTGESITPKNYAERKAKGDMTLNDVIGYKKVKYKGSGQPVITTDNKGNDHHIYKMINLRGDGQYATEHYTDDRMSVLNNGTMKIDFEIPDEDIIEFYGGEPTYLDFEEVQPLGGFEIQKPVQGVENIPNSGLTIEESNNFIDLLQPQIINQAYIENKAKTANMMFSFGLRWAKNIPNATEKSEQAKNLGQPRPDRKQIKSKESMTYGYYLTDQNNKPLPSIKELQPIMDFIQSKLGIDMSNYDAMLGNIYDDDSFIHQHRDTTESVTAQNYPVIVMNLGANGHLEYDKDVKSTYASYKKSGQLDLTNGGIYAFGVNGENRFTFHHRIGSGLESDNLLKPIKLPNGQILRNYRITLTFRRAADLEPGMPQTPNRISQENVVPSQPETINGENISSKGSEFAKKLTNPGNNVTVEYEGKTFRNAEHAYQTWKSGTFDETAYKSTAFKPVGSKPANRNTNYQTMVDILTAKLQQHPELVQGINERGGLGYIQSSTHNVTGDVFWESKGQNKFIEALAEAYQKVQPKQTVSFDTLEEFTDERKQEVLANFAAKHKMTEEQAKNYINEALSKNKEEVINKLKDCY